ncbi:MAG TPA: hypothetical protein VF234_03175 [Limnochordia bacterium]
MGSRAPRPWPPATQHSARPARRRRVAAAALAAVLWAAPVQAGSLSLHVGVGKLIGRYSRTPAEAFVLGFLSHAVLDTVVHDPVVDWQTPGALARQAGYIGSEAGLSLFLIQGMTAREWWGVLGSVAPDLIDGLYSLAHPEAWWRGELLLPWHRASGVPVRTMSDVESLRLSVLVALTTVRF